MPYHHFSHPSHNTSTFQTTKGNESHMDEFGNDSQDVPTR
jgi:hypothetical protein